MKRVCGLQRIEIIAKTLLYIYEYTADIHTRARMRFFCMRPLLLLYDSVDFSPRACAPGTATLLLRIFVGKLPRRPVLKERVGSGKLHADNQVVLFFPRVGTWTHV